jgi:hypothetical protein
MKPARRKKIITIETFQRTVICQTPNLSQTLWCKFCRAEVEMTAPENAATILEVGVREIYRRIEEGGLHFIELENGQVFVCFQTNSYK